MIAETTAQQRTVPVKAILVVILAAIVVTAIGRLLLTGHAVERHGAEAQQIRECLERNGPVQTWQQNDDPSVRVFCVELEPEPCSRWGILIAQVFPSLISGCDFRERTAFVPRDGSPQRITSYLERFATRIR